MKKTGLINQPVSNVVAGMGHLDRIVIADAGLPVPEGPERIDLAISANMPPFLDVLKAVLSELEVQEAIVAEEIQTHSPEMFANIQTLLGDIPIRQMSHEAFKQETRNVRAVVRSGEFTPYANVMLVAGVVF